MNRASNGEWLRSLRERLGLSQSKIGKAAGISRGRIAGLEGGLSQDIRLWEAAALLELDPAAKCPCCGGADRQRFARALRFLADRYDPPLGEE